MDVMLSANFWMESIKTVGFPIAIIIGFFVPYMIFQDKNANKWIKAIMENYDQQSKERHDAIIKGFDRLAEIMTDGFQGIQDTFEKHEERDHEKLENIYNKIDEHHSESNKQFNRIARAMGNTVLSEQQTISLFKEKMWYVSHGKINFIKEVIRKNHIKWREKEVRDRIRAELINKSASYQKDFWDFTTPIWDLNDWLEKNFTEERFEKLVDDIMDIVQKKYNKEIPDEAAIEMKANEISTLMKNLQNDLASKLQEDIKKQINF